MPMVETARLLSGLALLLALVACEEAAPPGNPAPSLDSPATYFSTMRKLSVEVAYEPGAEPFVGVFGNGANGQPLPPPFGGAAYWEIARANLAGLFAERPAPVTVTIPTDLAGMTPLPAQGRISWDVAAITELARATRTHTPTAEHGGLLVLFVSGFYEKNGELRPDVLGVHAAGTPFVAMFKDVVRTVTESPASDKNLIPLFTEQVVLVHEVGHALGLVDNGIPPVTDHRDEEHGRHCTNPACVMFHKNEGKESVRAFGQASFESGQLVWYGPECLEDARTFAP